MGTNGRGAQHAKMFSRMPGVEVGYICDPEEKALAKGMKAVSPDAGESREGGEGLPAVARAQGRGRAS